MLNNIVDKIKQSWRARLRGEGNLACEADIEIISRYSNVENASSAVSQDQKRNIVYIYILTCFALVNVYNN